MEDAAWDEDVFASIKTETVFTGYEADESEVEILAVAKDGVLVSEAEKGDEITVILDKTPFYAESGGQIGDMGFIKTENAELEVCDTKKQNGKFLHKCVVVNGTVKTGENATATVDAERRNNIRKNHSSAHLLQAALKSVLGDHIAQAGSYVTENRMRFDFSHFEAMKAEEIKKTEELVNKYIMQCIPVETMVKSIDEAKKMGATALFGEKYGETVRIVKMGDCSMEFCGGTHVLNTGNIGLFKIVSESGVAAGVRRIEAVTGMNVIELIDKDKELIQKTAEKLKANPAEIAEKANSLNEEVKNLKREIESIKSKLANSKLDEALNNVCEVNGTKVIAERLDDGLDMNALRTAGDNLKSKFEDAVIVLASSAEGKVNLVAMATKAAVEKGANAGAIIREVAKITGGGGGGKADNAQAGGKDASKIGEALAKVKELL